MVILWFESWSLTASGTARFLASLGLPFPLGKRLPQAAWGGQRCCLLSLLKAGMGGKRDFTPFRRTDKPPGSLPFTDHPWASPFKSQREGHRVTWLIRTSPSNTRYPWLIPDTLIQHSCTTLAVSGSSGSCAASQERSLVPRGGEGCWQTWGGWEPCSGEQVRVHSGTAEHIWFATGHRG